MKRRLDNLWKYFLDFYALLDKGTQEKIDYVFEMVKTLEMIPRRFFQHLENTEGLYEIRVEFESNIYRIICFFDEGNLVVLTNSFQKKSQKTPKKEIELAKQLRKQYFSDKAYEEKRKSGKKVKK